MHSDKATQKSNMKVIVAGLHKTGTRSLNAALKRLGYKVYDYMENAFVLQEDYKKIFHEGWTTEDFKRMYEDVDAITDFPACYFWEEIHKAFPDAKIILSMRENEDIWAQSVKKEIIEEDANIWLRLMEMLSPSFRKMMKFVGNPTLTTILGMQGPSTLRIGRQINVDLLKLKYRAHNAHVLKNAPTDRLLVLKGKKRWKPLCEFLGEPIPDEPFPNKTTRDNIVEELIAQDPFMKKMMQEMMISSSVLLVGSAVVVYYFYQLGPSGVFSFVCNILSSVLNKIS